MIVAIFMGVAVVIMCIEAAADIFNWD